MDDIVRRASLVFVAALALALPASAAGESHALAWAFQARCGAHSACILKVARIECRALHDPRHCAIAHRAMIKQAVAHIARLMPALPVTHVLTACTTTSCLQAYAMALGDQTWGPGGGSCLVAIVNIEDPPWNVEQWNTAGSGAYGLGQALPASQMAVAGPDYMTNGITQLKWMARVYISGRYGTSCVALEHEHEVGWY
jgi:hypothetical protein